MSAHPECQPERAVEFLQDFAPNEPWLLTAITPDGPVETKEFRGDDRVPQVKEWIENNSHRNLHYHVNPVDKPRMKGGKTQKATKTDISEVRHFHLDIDPRDGEDRESERERISAISFDPEPTFLIDSGNGHQALWRLSDPIELDSTEEAADDAAQYNLAIANQYGGDLPTRDVSRLLRLPFTVNWPSKKKRRMGRKPVATKLLSYTGKNYPVSVFEKTATRRSSTPTIILDAGELDKIEKVDAKSLPVSDSIKDLIVHGHNPGAPNQYPSRSEALFKACCEMVRSKCSDETICSIITNAKYGISESVLDKGSGSRKYAVRQIKRAREAQNTSWNKFNKETKTPIPNYHNTRSAILKLGITCSYDTFHNRLCVGGHQLQEYQGELSDKTCAMIRQIILNEFDFDPGKEHTRDASHQLCIENYSSSICEYYDGLSWDGIQRVEGWFHRYLGTMDTAINRIIGTMMLTATVRRARQPGCKYDTIVVLEGTQGTGKSTALEILAGEENFSDQAILALDARSQMEAIEGVSIYEISELEGMTPSKTIKIKAFASRRVDRGRPAYGRFSEKRPRQGIFVGTTNETKYLHDPTGNRRFLPVKTNDIDLVSLRADRDQLWAEAVHLEATGASITLPPEMWSEATEIQAERIEDDPWLEKLTEITGTEYNNRLQISSAKILYEDLKLDINRMSPKDAKRVGILMRQLGWEGPKSLTFPSGKKRKGYCRPISTTITGPNDESEKSPF
jgi:virulence-associated protein E/DNA primase RepB-like protein